MGVAPFDPWQIVFTRNYELLLCYCFVNWAKATVCHTCFFCVFQPQWWLHDRTGFIWCILWTTQWRESIPDTVNGWNILQSEDLLRTKCHHIFLSFIVTRDILSDIKSAMWKLSKQVRLWLIKNQEFSKLNYRVARASQELDLATLLRFLIWKFESST